MDDKDIEDRILKKFDCSGKTERQESSIDDILAEFINAVEDHIRNTLYQLVSEILKTRPQEICPHPPIKIDFSQKM